MIDVETMEGNAVAITLPGKIEVGDFPAMAPEVDALIAKHGTIRIALDISAVRGWAGWRALKEHIGFVRAHHRTVRRMAVITGPAWQRMLVRIMRLIVFPRVKLFDHEEMDAARRWLQGTTETE